MPCELGLTLQVDAGAEVVVTQPPLLWTRFLPWFDAVHRCWAPNLPAADMMFAT